HEHVVDAVVDDVDAHTAHVAEAGGELDLRADAVGRGDQHRVVELEDPPGRQHPAEAPDAAQHVGGEGPFDGPAHALDGAGALVDVDAGLGVRVQQGAGGTPADVAAHLHVGEPHAVHAPVGGGSGGGEIVAEAGDRQHPATG